MMRNICMMWLPLEIAILSVIHMHAASDFSRNTLVSNSNEISCAGNTTIKIIDLNVQQYSTSCSEYKHCNLTEQQHDDIKGNCSRTQSCSISKIIPNSCVFDEYGHVSVPYSCKDVVNSSCTFDNGQCDWTIIKSDKYKWTLHHGETSKSYTGPDNDHTTASGYGQYMYTRSLGGSKSNDESNLLSGLIVSSPKQCLTFWYHMYGNDINTLTVFQLNNEHTIELWSKSYNQGNKWYFQSLSLNINIEPYQIMFKATRGNSGKSEIAVDDISIANTGCKKAIDCNFERGQCGWKTKEPKYQWTNWHSSTPSDYTGPVVDHTLGTSVGGYIYLEASNISQGRKSNFTSETIYPDGDSCLNFWYYMYGEGMGTLNVYLDSEDISRIVWSTSGNLKKRWWLAFFTISKSVPYQIIFEGIRGNSSKSDIALDDISLFAGSCKKASVLDCTFEVNNCNWSTFHETPFNWKITEKPLSSNEPGPHADHTIGTADGHYIYLKRTGLNVQKGDKFNLTSPAVSPSDSCFTFWYHLYGKNIGTLNVYTESGNNTEKRWSRSGNHGNNWLFANLDISKSEPYKIIFEGIHGYHHDYSSSDIALDDIQLLQRTCSDFTLDCSFEESNCYWSNFHETPYIWKQIATPFSDDSPGPYTDHTTGADGGHYIYLQRTCSKNVKYNLISHIISPNGDTCFTFWYHMYGLNIGTLSVYTKSENTTEMHWSQSGNDENSWQFAHFDISKSEPYSIIFEGVCGDGDWSDIALDDILLLQRSCSGSINYSQLCHKMDETISLPECSKHYLLLNKTSLVFNPKFDDCFAEYQDIQTSFLNLCNDINNSDICTFNLSDVTKKESRCFQSNRLLIEYSCQVSDTSDSFPSVTTKPRKLETGLVVGLVIGGLLLICVVIVIFVLIKRQTFVSGTRDRVRNTLRENDYIGCQDVELPHKADHSGHMQLADQQTTNDDEYAIGNTSAETSFNDSIDDRNRTADSSMILDKKNTGFNRTISDTPRGYEFAQSLSDTRDNFSADDQYSISDGVYDHSGNNRHKESEDNIYNHAVDTVYDSGSHKRNNKGTDDTYDHFFGQKTEDDYDVSTTT